MYVTTIYKLLQMDRLPDFWNANIFLQLGTSVKI